MNTPTKEQVLKAAETSPEAKEVLKKLFPDYFRKEINLFELSCTQDKYYLFTDTSVRNALGVKTNLIGVRPVSNLARKAFYLSEEVNWRIERDEYGVLCLIPSLKD